MCNIKVKKYDMNSSGHNIMLHKFYIVINQQNSEKHWIDDIKSIWDEIMQL